ncbi:MAG: zinc ribbon domain-containing protein [Phycisphaerae bacterium]
MPDEQSETLLAALQRLQRIELKLASIKGKREVKLRRVSLRQRKIREVDKKLEELQRDIRERQMKLDALALDVAAREDAVQKHREALNKAKTNKEYAGILAAMNTEKADTARIETGVFALMEEVQARKKMVSDQELHRRKLLEELHAAERTLEQFDAEQRAEQADLEAARAGFSEMLPPTALATFSRVASRHEGHAMAPVVKLHPKRDDYGCSGCNITVSLETVNVLQSRDELRQCGSCGRILYLSSPYSDRG